ncbi:MAG: EAL domain-containing protein [Acidihalobacter sp.]
MTDDRYELADEDVASLIPHLRDVVFRTRGKAYWAYLSPAWSTLTGYSVEESLGRHILEFVHPDDREQNDELKERLEGGRVPASRHIKRMIRKDGSVVWVEADVRVLYDDEGVFQGSAGTLRDVSGSVRLQATLRKERRVARTTLAALSDGVVTLDAALRVEFMNGAALELTGLDEGGCLGRPIAEVLVLEGGDLSEAVAGSLAQLKPRFLGGRTQLLRADGAAIDVDLTVTPLVEGGGCVIVLRDVREQRVLQAKLLYQANHDPLTRLSNRAAMQEALAREHGRALRRNAPYTLLLVDLDHFKVVNDHYGHALGDEALKAVARSIRGGLRDGDWLARWGGEEVLCLLPDTGAEEGARIAERIRATVEQLEIRHQGLRVPLTVSIGVGCNDELEDAAEAVLLSADAALYEAKQAGRNQVWCGGEGGLDVIGMAARVQEALQLGRLRLAFQPIIDLSSGDQIGSEALARLAVGNGRYFEAAAFIQAARRLHLLHRVDAALIPQAMGHCSEGLLAGEPRLHFVNVSADMLRRPSQVRNMLDQAERNCASCGDLVGKDKPLVLELSEREFLSDTLRAREALAPLLEFGMQLAIDHFGSGYASLRYLGDLPVNFIKLEGDLLRSAVRKPSMRAVVRGMRQMAEDLGARTIAEQVEDAETDELIRELGIGWAQGRYYAPPQEPLDIVS